MKPATYEQTVIPQSTSRPERMTFSSELTRNRYIREQRAYGYEVFLSYEGTDRSNKELYSITRRKLS